MADRLKIEERVEISEYLETLTTASLGAQIDSGGFGATCQWTVYLASDRHVCSETSFFGRSNWHG